MARLLPPLSDPAPTGTECPLPTSGVVTLGGEEQDAEVSLALPLPLSWFSRVPSLELSWLMVTLGPKTVVDKRRPVSINVYNIIKEHAYTPLRPCSHPYR